MAVPPASAIASKARLQDPDMSLTAALPLRECYNPSNYLLHLPNDLLTPAHMSDVPDIEAFLAAGYKDLLDGGHESEVQTALDEIIGRYHNTDLRVRPPGAHIQFIVK
jgi:hypothetical protein